MAKMKILGGDIPQVTSFYHNPGAICDRPVTAVIPVSPDELKNAGVRTSFGLVKKAHFIAEFDDGKRALVETNQRTYDRIIRDIADGPVSAEVVEERKKGNIRMAVVFCVFYVLGVIVISEYLPGWLPYIAAFCLAVIAGAVSRGISFGR